MVCWIMDLKELLEGGVDVSKCFCLQGCAMKNGRYVSDLTMAENLLRPLFSCLAAMPDSDFSIHFRVDPPVSLRS